MNGGSDTREAIIQLPETAKMGGSTATNVTVTGTLVSSRRPTMSVHGWRMEIVHLILRLACLLTSVTALAVMITAKQASTISLYGFSLPVSSKWSLSASLEYLVGVSAAAAVHSLLQLFISGSRTFRKSPVIPSRNHAWLLFVGDQVFALAMMSAGSAASGVTNLNRTGIRHSALPNFCKPLNVFCNRVAVSIVFTFFSCFLLASSVVLDVFWLSKY